jgi:hypothetical protein
LPQSWPTAALSGVSLISYPIIGCHNHKALMECFSSTLTLVNQSAVPLLTESIKPRPFAANQKNRQKFAKV